jgi:hypothetical protein
MIEAEMRNKIRSGIPVANQEDVLTSNVFGLLNLINISFLFDILKSSKPQGAQKELLLTGALDGNGLWFWKNITNQNENSNKRRDEPDIYFQTTDGIRVIIEVKYLSGESYDEQLSDYARHCDHIVYLTPANAMAFETLDKYKSSEIADKLFCLSWTDFNSSLKDLNSRTNGYERMIINKITNYLDYKHFKAWNGWGKWTEVADLESSKFYLSNYFYNLDGCSKLKTGRFYKYGK